MPVTYGLPEVAAVTVRVTPAEAGGPSPGRMVTFRLNGRLAGSSYIDASGGQAYFEADPGTYTLTAHYGGDQNYAPADLPPTVITIPGGSAPDAAFLSVNNGQLPAVINSGATLVDPFTVGVDSQTSLVYADAIKADVFAVNEVDPTVLVPLQTLSQTVTVNGPGTTASFASVAGTTGLVPGTYQLAYAIQDRYDAATIYSADSFTVMAVTPPPAGLPAVGQLVGTSVPVVAGVGRRLSTVVDVPGMLAGADTITVYATETGTIDGSSKLLGSVHKRVTVKGGATVAAVTVPIQTAAAPAGTYILLARVINAAKAVTDGATGPTLVVELRSTVLSGTVNDVSPASVRVGQSVGYTLTVTNAGNVPTTGPAALAVYLSADGVAMTVAVQTANKNLSVQPGRSVRLRLRFRVPTAAVGMTLLPLVVVTQDKMVAIAVASEPVAVRS